MICQGSNVVTRGALGGGVKRKKKTRLSRTPRQKRFKTKAMTAGYAQAQEHGAALSRFVSVFPGPHAINLPLMPSRDFPSRGPLRDTHNAATKVGHFSVRTQKITAVCPSVGSADLPVLAQSIQPHPAPTPTPAPDSRPR